MGHSPAPADGRSLRSRYSDIRPFRILPFSNSIASKRAPPNGPQDSIAEDGPASFFTLSPMVPSYCSSPLATPALSYMPPRSPFQL